MQKTVDNVYNLGDNCLLSFSNPLNPVDNIWHPVEKNFPFRYCFLFFCAFFTYGFTISFSETRVMFWQILKLLCRRVDMRITALSAVIAKKRCTISRYSVFIILILYPPILLRRFSWPPAQFYNLHPIQWYLFWSWMHEQSDHFQCRLPHGRSSI